MSSLFPRYFILFIVLLTFSAVAAAQVVVTDDFETNNVGDFPVGWTQVNGSVGYALATGSPVASGARAVRLSAGLSTASTIRITTAITNDYVYEYYVLIPDTGLVNETIGSVKVENVGMSFALGATPSEGIIYFSNMTDGFVVATNVYHHVKVEVDYQKNVLRTTVDGLQPKKYPASINTAQDLRLEATALSSVLQKHIVYVDSVSVSLMTVDLTPAYTLLSSPADGATELGASSAPSFSWSSVSLATGYTLQISTDSTFATGIVYDDTTITGTSKSVPLPPLSPATNYFWRVRAKNTIGWGDWSLVRKFRTVDPPGAPVLDSPSDAAQLTTADDIYFSYSSPSGTQAFQFQIALDSLFTTMVVNDSASSAATYRYIFSPPLQVLQHYYWRVRSLATAGWGAWSVTFDFFTPQPLSPPALSGPANGYQSTDVNSVYLSWSYVSNATQYWLVVAKDSNFTTIVVNDSTQTATAVYQYFPPLEYNTTHYWKVRTGSVAGWGAYSPWRTFKTKPTPTVTLSSPSDGSVEGGSSVYLAGSAPFSDAADSFYVQISLDSLFSVIAIEGKNANGGFTFDMNQFTASTKYYWRMRARNVAGWGAYSARRAFVIANPPVAPTLSSPANNAQLTGTNIYLDWALLIGTALEYQVQIATDNAFSNVVLTLNETSSASSTTIPPLSGATLYYWRVRARSIIGWGSYSAAWSFTTMATPNTPVLNSPAPGTNDLTGTVLFSWTSSPGKDTTHVQVTTDTNSVPSRVIGGARTASALATNNYFVYYYDNLYLNVTSTVGNNQRFFIRLRDHNGAGYGGWSPWSVYTTQRPPVAPVLLYPSNGATNVPFITTPFVSFTNPVAHTNVNLTVFSGTTTSGSPVGTFPMEHPYELPQALIAGFALQMNATYTAICTAFNPAGSITSDPCTFTTAAPFPDITCVMDVDDDQGGFVEIDAVASELDLLTGVPLDFHASPIIEGPDFTLDLTQAVSWVSSNSEIGTVPNSGVVTNYSVCRVHQRSTLWEERIAEIQKKVSAMEPRFQMAFSVLDSTQLLEPLMTFTALGEDKYRTTVRTQRDSGANRQYVETYMVIAHTGAGRQFRSLTATGYSVDNLAPNPPGGGAAAPDGGTMRVHWTANGERDLADYAVYRSSQSGQDVHLLTPIATTIDPLYVDPSPLPDAVSYYYIVARDKNDNKSEPAVITANRVTGVEAFGGVPTEYSLSQNYPNPFNPSTTIRFGVPFRSHVTVQIVDMLGQIIETAAANEFGPGFYGVTWEARVPSGTYLYRIVATSLEDANKSFTAVKKMVLLK